MTSKLCVRSAMLGIVALTGLVALSACSKPEQSAAQAPAAETAAAPSPSVPLAETPIERGRYLVLLGGCNECHTDSFVAGWPDAKLPESEWLTGSAIGFRGPWGTTYPSNLRLRVTEISEDDWAQTLRTRTSAPPMPWSEVNSMTESDARAIYAFIKSLGPKGAAAPAAVPPSEEPGTAYVWMMPITGPAPAAPPPPATSQQ